MLKSQIESILFIYGKPITLRELAKICGRSKDEIEVVLEDLRNRYDSQCGINIVLADGQVQMVSNAQNKELVEGLIEEQIISELTQPQLEALTIIAYRGPITKLELETIRGVNCSLILRNLLIKGLITANGGKYQITVKFMQHLGISSVEELPDYDRLSKSETIEEVLNKESK